MMFGIIQQISSLPISSYLTIAMLVLLGISFLFGLLRGIRKSFFYTIFYLFACAFFFLSLDKLTMNVLYTDISSANLNIAGVSITSLAESMPEVLRSLLSNANSGDYSNMFVPGTESFTLMLSLLGFGVQIVLCLGFIVFFQIAYKIIVWLLWITLGRWMFKMKYRENGKVHKKKKHRILGGFMGLVPGCISVLMLFIPLSGFFSVASSMTNTKNEGVSFGDVLSEEDYKSLQKAIGSYEESMPGKIFNIAVSSDGRSLDLWAFDKMITVNVDGNEFNIRKDLENIGTFASNIMSTGLLSVVTDTNFTANDLIKVLDEDSEVITSAFESLGEVELIDLIMNTGVEFLDSSRLIDEKMELQTDSINYNNLAKLDWSNEFKQLGNILISGIEVLDALNETDKNKPFNELSFSLETIDSFNAEKTEKALNNFINELFESNLINEGTTAGLEYIFGMSQVKDIVGEVDKEDLKKIDLKSDLLKVTSAIKSVINISINNFTSINLQELSNQSIELKNIIDELFDLEIFKLVEENVIDYAITNYIENNENILKFVNVNELRELRLIDFKIELGAIIETFGKLGEQTEIFDVEGLEEGQKLNFDAVNSKALRLINENLAKSDTIYKFIDDVLHGVLVPSIFEDEEEYNDLISNFEVKTTSGELDGPKTREKWTGEINVFVNMLEAIEEEMAKVNEVFSIYSFATAENIDIKLGMLRGMTAKDKENTDEYLLDESILVSEVMINMINEKMEGNEILDGVFDDDTLSYGLEIDTLVKIMVEAEIVEDRNDAVISPSTLEDEFSNLNDAKLTAFANNIDNSRILQKVLRNALKEVVSNDLYLEMDSWGDVPGKWSTEMHSLRNILIDGGFANDEGNIVIEEMGDLDSVNYVQLDAISSNIDNSEILQDVLATTLIDSGFELEDKDNDGKYDVIWSKEFAIIRDVVGSETYQVDGEWSKMSISELSELSCIRPETLVILSKQINNSSLLKNALKEPLKDLLKNDDDTYYSDPEIWTDEEWSKELKSIAYVTIPLATKNAEKEANGYPSDRVYIDINNIDIENEIKLAVLENVLGGVESDLVTESNRRRTSKKSVIDETNNEFGINHSSLLRKLLKDALESSVNVEDTSSSDYKYNVDFDSFTNNQYYYEVEALINVIKDAKIYDERDNVKYININTLSDKLEKITKELVSSITGQVANSIILRKQMQKNLEPTVGEEFAYTEMNSWTIETWQDEMVALDYIVFTLEEDAEGAIDLEIEDEINIATIDAISEKHYSLLVREMMISALDEDTEQDMSSWKNNPNQWKDELHAIDVLANELAVDGKINLNDMSFEDENGNTEVKVSLLSSLGDVIHGSTFVQEKLNENLFTDENYRHVYPSVEYSEVKNQWNDEVNSLYNVINGTSYIKNGYFYPDNIDFENDIDIKLLENLSTTVHKSAFLQSKLDDGLFNDAAYEVYYPVVAYSLNENQWNDEVESLYNVINGTSYVVNGKFNPNDIDFGGSIDIKVIDNISKTIHKSAYLQSKLDAELFNDAAYKVYYPVMGYSEIENQWNDEMASLYNTISGTSYVVDDKVDPNSIDFSGSVDIKVLDNISKTVHKSAYLQSKLDAELFNDAAYKAYYPEVGFSKDKNQWNDEMESLYITIVGTSYVVDGKVDPNSIDFSGSIDIKVLDNISKTVHKSTYLQSKLDAELFNDAAYEAYYPNVNYSLVENQWNAEMSSLYNTINETSYVVDGKVDPNSIDFSGSVDIKVLDNISKTVHKSTYLQSKLDAELFNDVAYEAYYPNVNYSLVENQWNAEMSSLYNTINETSYVVDGKVDPNSIDFSGSVDIKVLDNISKTVHESSYLQSKLDAELFNDAAYKVYYPVMGYSEIENQWNAEMSSLYNTISGTSYVVDDKVDPNSIDFSGSIDIKVLDNISKTVHKSTYLQSKLDAELFNDAAYKVYYPVMGYSLVENQWNDEMESLYNTIAGTSYVVDGKVDPNAIDFGGSIDIRLLENTSLFINKSTYMQGKIENALFTDFNYQSEYPSVGFSKVENQWNDEMSSLYNVMNGTSYVVANKIDIDAIDFENSIDIKVLDNISKHVHKSAYLQSKLDGALFTDANYQAKYPSVDYSKVENRWNAEIGALYSAIYGTSYVVGGTFNPNGLDFNSSIDVKILFNISENIHESTYLQSKLDTTLFTNDSYKSEDPSKAIFPIVKFEEEKNQWNDEINALYNVINGSTYVDSNGMFSPSSLNITGVINVSILANLKANISKSTYLQSKLEATLEDLVEKDPTKEEVYLLDRADIGADYNLEFDATSGAYVFDLVPKFNDSDYAWRVEVGTMVDIILDPRSNVVDLNGNVDLHHISEGLHDFSINMLGVASDKLDSNGHTAYGSSKIIRLNLVKPLETLATRENGGVIIKDGKYVTRESLGFKWIDSIDGTVSSDLHDLNEFFNIIGATTHSEAVTILETLTLASLTPAKIAQLSALATSSYYIGVLVYNHGLSI